ncbi:MAG: 3-deoxy-7-phosphoheptulonate synthase [Verrucomicrobiales bacterium]|nr:MAG: 3-deoxy-7-phosphoheptulonate synthase [Verrucomicrobiaceae bacterium]
MQDSDYNTDDLRIDQIRQLIAPALLMSEFTVSENVGKLVSDARVSAASILNGSDDRLLVVVGPCSIHDVDAAVEYASKLKDQIDKHKDDLLIIMRVYFEKPRTTVGWKGLINDPDLDGSFDINKGLEIARKLLIDINELGVPAGTEFLDTISPQYIADLVSWGAIGARTTESQIHRELASGLSMPIGFKNGTGGSVQIAVDGIKAASMPHNFLSVTKQGVSAIVCTVGNQDCHIILRGSSAGPNYDSASILETSDLLEKSNLPRPLMIDCSHGNSLKDHKNQPKVAADVSAQLSEGNSDIAAVMVESNIEEGNQKLTDDLSSLNYGQSVTDACVDWSDTESILEELAQGVRARRGSS